MAPIAPRTQATFFYNSTWTRQVDTRFISRLVRESHATENTLTINHSTAIKNAQVEINESFGTSFSFPACVRRFKRLRERYDVFAFITNLTGINYDELHNTLHASDYHLWDYICMVNLLLNFVFCSNIVDVTENNLLLFVKKHRMGEAYMIEGESAWHELCQIFGAPTPNIIFTDTEVVDLTSEASASVEFPTNVQQYQREASASIEYPTNVQQYPRELFQLPPANANENAFWNELARFNDGSRSPSVVEIDAPVARVITSPPRDPLPPRCLWPPIEYPTFNDNYSNSHSDRNWPPYSDVSDEASSSAFRHDVNE